MSSIKSPQEKKAESLEHDCRNAFGENDKASRKLIPLRKQQSHQEERRALKQPLFTLKGQPDEDQTSVADIKVKTLAIKKRRSGFTKKRDATLSAVLQKNLTGRWPER